jgi:hypothetical protein
MCLKVVDTRRARWTAWHNYASAALRDRGRIVNEVREVVPMDLLLNGGEEGRLLHGASELE